MAEYSVIPDEWKLGIDKWFSSETIKEKYDGDILKACEDHPIYFAYYLFGIKLRYYQAYVIDLMLTERFIQGIWGRRMGKTWMFKIFASWALWYNKYPTGAFKTTNIIVIGQNAGTSEGYIEDLANLFAVGDERVFRLFKGKLGSKYFTSHFPKKMDKAKNNTTEFNIFNKGWNGIKAFAPTPKARGEGASIMILDELAFWEDTVADAYTIYNSAIRPITTDTADTKIFIATTPNGSTGLSYDLMDIDGHQTRYKLLWFPYYYRDEQAYLEEMENVRKEYADQGRELDFRQEYLAEITTKANAYFTEVERNNVFKNPDVPFLTHYSGECELGLDFGGSTKSHTSITISRKWEGKYQRIYNKRYPVSQDSELQHDLLQISKAFPRIRKFHIDSQGGGSSFYGWMRKTFGVDRIDEVSFRAEKQEMYRLFKIRCFQGLPESYYDKVLNDEFLNFTGDLRPGKDQTDDDLDSFVMSIKDWIRFDEKSSWKVANVNEVMKNGRKIGKSWKPYIQKS